jgi:hypothetical protein
MKPDAADNSVPREISARLSNERLILRETQRAVTPLGGVAAFVAVATPRRDFRARPTSQLC